MKHNLEFINHDGTQNPEQAELAVQTNNVANELARANELKKIELQISFIMTSEGSDAILGSKVHDLMKGIDKI